MIIDKKKGKHNKSILEIGISIDKILHIRDGGSTVKIFIFFYESPFTLSVKFAELKLEFSQNNLNELRVSIIAQNLYFVQNR